MCLYLIERKILCLKFQLFLILKWFNFFVFFYSILSSYYDKKGFMRKCFLAFAVVAALEALAGLHLQLGEVSALV